MIYALYQDGLNCWRACLATILRVGLDDLPETIDGPACRERGVSQLQATRRALRERGLDLVRERPEQKTIRPAGGLYGEFAVAGVTVDGHGHALVAVEADGVFWSLWDPAIGDPRDAYPLVDVTRVVPWPRPSKVAAALARAVPRAS